MRFTTWDDEIHQRMTTRLFGVRQRDKEREREREGERERERGRGEGEGEGEGGETDRGFMTDTNGFVSKERNIEKT